MQHQASLRTLKVWYRALLYRRSLSHISSCTSRHVLGSGKVVIDPKARPCEDVTFGLIIHLLLR